MDWQTLLASTRFGSRPAAGADGRSPFQVDFDRIVFSGWFHRLQGKTQVHPMPDNDHVHTRLTHTLEVGSVGRSLGETVGLGLRARGRLPDGIVPSDIGAIVQAAAMAHDIGNPPFGHAGEFAIRDWFGRNQGRPALADLSNVERADLLGFEGNAQGLRVVSQLENNYRRGGLRLTFATLGSLVKYPWPSDHDRARETGKFGYFAGERDLFVELAKTLGLPDRGAGQFGRHPLVYLVEAADDICYALIDLEDGVELGLIGLADFIDHTAPLTPQFKGPRPEDGPRRTISYLRTQAIGALVEAAAEVFLAAEQRLLAGEVDGDLLSLMADPAGRVVAEAKDLARRRIFEDRRKKRLEIGSYATIDVLLSHFVEALQDIIETTRPTFKSQRVIALLGPCNAPDPAEGYYAGLMKICDYVAGMTDQYANGMAQQLNGGGR